MLVLIGLRATARQRQGELERLTRGLPEFSGVGLGCVPLIGGDPHPPCPSNCVPVCPVACPASNLAACPGVSRSVPRFSLSNCVRLIWDTLTTHLRGVRGATGEQLG